MEQRKEKENKCIRVSWQDLPQELLASIATRLHSSVDILSFRAVCMSWHLAASLSVNRYYNKSILSSLLPLKTPRYPSHRKIGRNKSYVLTAGAVYLIEPLNRKKHDPPQDWLLTVDELNSGSFHVRYPLSKLRQRLPADFPKLVNLFDFRFTEICKLYNLTSVLYNERKQKFEMPFSGHWSRFYDKVLLLSNPDIHSLTDPLSVSNSYAMILFRGGKLVLLTLEDMNWKMIHGRQNGKFDDIIFFDGKVCVINRRGRAYSIDYGTWEMNVIASAKLGGAGIRKRLIESAGYLYLVIRCTDEFRVYKLNKEMQKWDSVMTLCDRTFFIGADVSFSVSAHHLSGCHPNAIVSEKSVFTPYNSIAFPPTGVDIFHMDHGGSFALRQSLSKILGSPPAWFKQSSSANGL